MQLDQKTSDLIKITTVVVAFLIPHVAHKTELMGCTVSLARPISAIGILAFADFSLGRIHVVPLFAFFFCLVLIYSRHLRRGTLLQGVISPSSSPRSVPLYLSRSCLHFHLGL